MGQTFDSDGTVNIGNPVPMAGRNELGRHLLALRTAKELTQRQAADAVGISDGYLSKLENAKRLPERASAREVLIRLANLYGERPLTLLQLAGMEPRGASDQWPPIERLIRRHPELTAKQKRALQAQIDSWEIED